MRKRRSTIARESRSLSVVKASQQAYGHVFNDILQERARPFHLEVVNLSPGADGSISRLLTRLAVNLRRYPRRLSHAATV
jgi:hypothetical protein